MAASPGRPRNTQASPRLRVELRLADRLPRAALAPIRPVAARHTFHTHVPQRTGIRRALERAGELVRIDARLPAARDHRDRRPREQIRRAEPAVRLRQTHRSAVFHRGGPALLFTNVEGSSTPLLINAYGSYRRMELALGCHDPAPGLPAPRVPGGGGLQGYADRIASLVKPQPPSSIGEALAKAREFAPLLRIPPKRVKAAAHHEVVLTGDRVDLTKLPIIKCWPLDGDLESVGWSSAANANAPGCGLLNDPTSRGRYITLAGIHTIHADDEGHPKPSSRASACTACNCSGATASRCTGTCTTTARHWRSWKKKASPCPSPSRSAGRASSPTPRPRPCPGLSEILLAGFLRQRHPSRRRRPLRVGQRRDRHRGFVPTRDIPASAPTTPHARQLGPGAIIRDPSATTPASTPCPTATRSSRSPRSRCGATRSTRPPSSGSAAGGLLPRQGDRAHLPAAAQDAHPRHPRLRPAPVRRVPQLRRVQIHKDTPARRRDALRLGGADGVDEAHLRRRGFRRVHDTAAVLARRGVVRPGATSSTSTARSTSSTTRRPISAGTKIGFDCTRKREASRSAATARSRASPRALGPAAASDLLAREVPRRRGRGRGPRNSVATGSSSR